MVDMLFLELTVCYQDLFKNLAEGNDLMTEGVTCEDSENTYIIFILWA